MHWKTLKIVTVVALLASPSAFAAIPAQGAIEGAVRAASATSDVQLAHHRDGRHDRFDRGRDRGDGGRHVRDRRGRDHPHFRPHHRPRHFHGPRYFRGPWHRHYRGPRHGHFRDRQIRRFFRHWLRHHY